MKLIIVIRAYFFCILLVLTGCATGYAPVTDLSAGSTYKSTNTPTSKKYVAANTPSHYKVKSGDTLYSIAWKYGLDFKRLAKMNNIGSDYTIYKNQKLVIKQTAKSQKSSAIKNSSLNTKSKMSSKSDTISKNKTQKKKDNRKNSTKPSKAYSPKTTQSSASKTTRNLGGKVSWRWPAKGKVVKKFSSENKGLNISGVKGEAVYAAASGEVVYAGNGIIGYGNLLIIKHSEEYLSAYAHNSVILIREGSRIKGGVKIAEIGSSGTIKTILHFEIRKDGKPVNPLRYLPRK
jgi:lipoprotein NlpD